MSEQDFLHWLVDANGYIAPRAIGNGRWAALLAHFDPSMAIVTGRIGDRYGWAEKWTYPDAGEALVAYMLWDGRDEPAGWIRHQPSNRRVSRSPDERDENGEAVGAIGVTYIRP
jgi:hypothetical protein